MRALILLVLFCSCSMVSSAQTISQAEYFFDADPGVGQGTPLTITPGQSVNVNNLSFPVNGLDLDRPHTIFIRFRNTGEEWGMPYGKHFIVLSPQNGTLNNLSVTQAEYGFDGLSPVTLDVNDAANSTYMATIPTSILDVDKVHTFWTRFQDENGLWSAPFKRYFIIISHQPGPEEIHFITRVEYWFDSLSRTTVELSHNTIVNFTDLLPLNLMAGAHEFLVRYQDDRNLWSAVSGTRFVLVSGLPSEASLSRLAGAEYYIGTDPGAGNGLPISLPQDGNWDGNSETAGVVIGGLPRGSHLFGLRFRDDLGNWSMVLQDTFIVAPILVIRPTGNNIVLYWQADSLGSPFHIYRADSAAGAFSEIAQTDSMKYTDPGVIDSHASEFYHITTTAGALSEFRSPARDAHNAQQQKR